MKNILPFCSLLLLLLCSCSKQDLKCIEHFSPNSEFSISVPVSFLCDHSKSTDDFVVFRDAKMENIIVVKKKLNYSTEDFKADAYEDENQLKNFTNDIEKSTDNLIVYRLHKGTFSATRIYYLHKAPSFDYVIIFSGPLFDEKQAVKIAMTFKESADLAQSIPTIDGENTLYNKEGLSIKSSYRLVKDEMFSKLYRQTIQNTSEAPPLISAYFCLLNEADPDQATLINVVTYDLAAQIKAGLDVEEYMKGYTQSMVASGMSYKHIKYNDCTAIEYAFEQDFDGIKVPTKALFFVYNKKSILLQAASLNGVNSKFSKLKQSITTI